MKSIPPRSQRGFSLLELMVAMVISLIVMSGALAMFSQSLKSSNRLSLDIRLQQDLRLASDIIARDLRRANYWRDAVSATSAPGQSAPHDPIAVSGSASAAQLDYGYTSDSSGGDADASNKVAFYLKAQVIQLKQGDSLPQPLTDPAKIQVTRFSIEPTTREVSLGHLCDPVCTLDSPDCPRLRIHSYEIVIEAKSSASASVSREARQTVRVRNEDVSQSTCP